MDALKFVLELTNKVSPAAKQVETSLRSVRKELSSVTTTLGKGLDRGITKSANAIKKFGGDALASAGKAAVAFGATAATAFGAAGLAIAGYAVHHAIEAEKAHTALRTVIGDAKKADQALATVKGMSNFFGSDPRKIEADLTKLLTKGHDVTDALKILQGAADLGAMGNDANKLIDAFTEIDAKGKLSSEAIAAIAKSGVDIKHLRAQLGSAIGSTGDLQKDIEAAFAAGTVDAAKLQSAALLAITKTTGKALGGAAKDATKTISGQFETLKTLPTRIFDAASTSGAIEPLTKALSAVTTALNPETDTGKKVVAAIEKISASLGKVINKIVGPDGANVVKFVDGLAKGIEVVSDVIDVVADLIGDFIDEFSIGLDSILGPMDDFGGGALDMQSVIKGLSAVFKFLGAAVGITVGLVIQAVSWIIEGVGWAIQAYKDASNATSSFLKGVVGAIGGIAKTIGDFFVWLSELPGAAIAWGKSIVDGLWDGIKATWKGMIEKVKGLVDLLPAAVKKALGIASPSKVMMELGAFTALGFEKGLNDNADASQSALVGLVTPPRSSVSSSRSSSSVAPRVEINIEVNGADASSPDKLASDIATAVRREIINFHEQLAFEFGAPSEAA